jgi:hypothetical protein
MVKILRPSKFAKTFTETVLPDPEGLVLKNKYLIYI